MKRAHRVVGNAALLALALASCATPGTESHAMTGPEHQAAAKREEQASKEHNAQYDPSQGRSPPTAACPYYNNTCYRGWTSVGNPTERHLAEGKRHAERAAQHRADSQALREAETRACVNVPEGERDVSPFYHREDIVSAAPFKEAMPLGGGRVVGAEIVFASLPGMTAEWLQRVVDCHLARNEVIGAAMKEMAYCPLAVPHVKACVLSVGSGFAVDFTSNDEARGREILSRTGRLTGATLPQASK
jgi:hypothetical protein